MKEPTLPEHWRFIYAYKAGVCKGMREREAFAHAYARGPLLYEELDMILAYLGITWTYKIMT